ncbi:MAG: hypothetical protein ABII08_04860 [Candidatus Beckwithbacteria bacterium]
MIKSKNLRTLACLIVGLVVFSSFFASSKSIFAQSQPDLVLTGFDTCWEVYDGGEWGPMWRAWSWIKIKNQGNEASIPSVVNVAYFTDPYLNTWSRITTIISLSSIKPGETKTFQGWSRENYSTELCQTSKGDYGLIIDYGGYQYSCGGSTVARVSFGDKEDVKTFFAWPGSLLPGNPRYSCGGGPTAPTTKPTFTPTPSSVSLVKIELEAERGNLEAPMQANNCSSAYNCQYLASPEGSGSGRGHVTFNVNIPKTGYYVVFGRVKGAGWSSDSFYVSWDNGAQSVWNIPHQWEWKRVSNQGAPSNWRLTAGNHTLKIRTREDGSQIDALVVTNDYNYQPDYFKACQQ